MLCPFCGGGGFYGDGAVSWLWGIFILLLPVAFFLFVVWIVYSFMGGKEVGSSESDEMKIAKKRYAKGELTKEEYQDLVKNLKQK